MAALSLALGLAEVVQAFAGGIRLETVFVDEGFGSLDDESLDLADLRARGPQRRRPARRHHLPRQRTARAHRRAARDHRRQVGQPRRVPRLLSDRGGRHGVHSGHVRLPSSHGSCPHAHRPRGRRPVRPRSGPVHRLGRRQRAAAGLRPAGVAGPQPLLTAARHGPSCGLAPRPAPDGRLPRRQARTIRAPDTSPAGGQMSADHAPLPDPSRLLRELDLQHPADRPLRRPGPRGVRATGPAAGRTGSRPRRLPLQLLPALGEGRDAAPHRRQVRLRRLRPLAVRRPGARARGLHRLPLERRGTARQPRAHGGVGGQRADVPTRSTPTSWSARSSPSWPSTSRRSRSG